MLGRAGPLLLLLALGPGARGQRAKACNVLVAVDQTAFPEWNKPSRGNDDALRDKVLGYLAGLNGIYQETILRDPPYQDIFFRLDEVRRLDGFMEGCQNDGVILAEFTKVAKSRDFCLAHLLTNRDFGCVIGLATMGGLCKNYGNVGWTKVHDGADDAFVVNTMAHEFGHNFGADHDGGEKLQYRTCSGQRAGIMSGARHSNFSTCSLSAMHAKLQQVLEAEEAGKDMCFATGVLGGQVPVTHEDLSQHRAACPDLPPDECQEDQPDPPEVPPPPPEPECGDLKVEEPFEECDCGKDYLECEDPCCYPAVLSQYDKDLNSSALPCHRNQKQVCLAPYEAPLKFGLLFPFLFILLLVLVLAAVLWLDWRHGKRRLYFHITEREERRREPLHVETEDQKERRLLRERGGGPPA